MSTGPHLVHVKCGPPCYACTVGVTSGVHTRTRKLLTFEIYESVVEYLEALPTGTAFRRADVWHALGGGPRTHNVVTRVMCDMRLHDMLRCVKRDPSGRVCYAYVLVRGDVRNEQVDREEKQTQSDQLHAQDDPRRGE